MTLLTRRRRLLLLGAVALVGASVAAGTLTRDGGSSGASAATPEPQPANRRTTAVERRDLVDTFDAAGTLGYGEQRSVNATRPGTVTALPEPGTEIVAGQPLYSVDDRPGPTVFDGELPMWRTLRTGVDDGPDVAQLEANLVWFGYAGEDLTVDEEFTWETRDAVENWQDALGVEETGIVEPADVWFTDGAVRVASTTVEVGDPAQGEILRITGTSQLVHVDLDAKYATYAQVGASVAMELADGTETTGTISKVADVADVTPGQNGEADTATVAIEVTPDGELAALDESPVTVTLVSDKVEGAFAVPLEAIVAKAGGGYALEVVADDGTTHLEHVELGRYADGWVQVTGNVTEGQTVVTA